jgi:hypothetical protein
VQTKGCCKYCGRALTRSGMARHLATCDQRRRSIAEADAAPTEGMVLHHVQVRDAWSGWYWLQLEVAAATTMQVLDRYLRSVWLECCGHSSQWSNGDAWRGVRIPMSKRIGSVLQEGVELVHVYDFGTTTETRLTLVQKRTGRSITKRPIELMARNEAPVIDCVACDRPAEWLCMQCVHEDDNSGGLCAVHVEQHPHVDYGEPMPVVNSPLVGMCGYTGPAEPPY